MSISRQRNSVRRRDRREKMVNFSRRKDLRVKRFSETLKIAQSTGNEQS